MNVLDLIIQISMSVLIQQMIPVAFIAHARIPRVIIIANACPFAKGMAKVKKDVMSTFFR